MGGGMEVYGALSQPGTSDYEAPAGVQPSIEAVIDNVH